VSIIRKNLNTTRKPRFSPCFEIDILKKEKSISPGVVRLRAAKIKKSKIRKYLILFKIVKMLSSIFLKKTSKIRKYNKLIKRCAESMNILIMHIIKNLHLASSRCKIDFP
jgi:ribosomal protein L30/L7E